MKEAVSRAIAAVYDCAIDPSLWTETLQHIADCFDDVGALLLYRREGGAIVTIVSPSLQACADAYAREWWRHDIRATRSMDYAYAEAAGAITDRHFITDEEMATHPIYTQFLAPFGLRWGAGLQVSPSAGIDVSLTVQRAAAKPPFDDADLDLLTDLGRHVEQSLRLGLRLIEAEAVKLALGDALGRLAVAAFLVGADGRLRFANAQAHRLLGDALVLRSNRLTCPVPSAQARLSALIRTACARQGQASAAERLPPLILDRAGFGRVALYVLPAIEHRDEGPTDAERGCVVLAVDLKPGVPLDPGLVRDVYGLTLGEARVAALVGSGVSPRRTADALALSEATVRTVLKRIFGKLDISRQAELVDLFGRLRLIEPTRMPI